MEHTTDGPEEVPTPGDPEIPARDDSEPLPLEGIEPPRPAAPDEDPFPLPPEHLPEPAESSMTGGDYADWMPATEEGFAAVLGAGAGGPAQDPLPGLTGPATVGRRLTGPDVLPPPDPRAFRPISPAPRTYPSDSIRPDASRPDRPRSRWKSAFGLLATSVLGAVVAIGILLGLGVLEPADDDVAAPVETTRTTVIDRVRTDIVSPETTELGLATAVGRKVIPSIVTVQVIQTFAEADQVVATGSGVILTDDGYIVTNEHVIEDGETYQVVLQDGRTYGAELIGDDVLTDLAVLRIDAAGLEPIEIGTTDDLSVGDTAIAVGNPLDLDGGPSLTVGVISAFNREVDVGADDDVPLFGMLQTDASFTRGSSGGALVDAEGRLIGITTAISVSSGGAEGIGFATPSELMVRITEEIIEIGRVRHAFLGITGRDFIQQNADGSTSPHGAEIVTLEGADSAAGAAGLQEGDRIVAFDGKEVRTMQDLVIGLRRYHVDDAVVFDIVRDGEELAITVNLGERPEGL